MKKQGSTTPPKTPKFSITKYEGTEIIEIEGFKIPAL
jgi:hypothetical protein